MNGPSAMMVACSAAQCSGQLQLTRDLLARDLGCCQIATIHAQEIRHNLANRPNRFSSHERQAPWGSWSKFYLEFLVRLILKVGEDF
jgi:hypothetical protein